MPSQTAIAKAYNELLLLMCLDDIRRMAIDAGSKGAPLIEVIERAQRLAVSIVSPGAAKSIAAARAAVVRVGRTIERGIAGARRKKKNGAHAKTGRGGARKGAGRKPKALKRDGVGETIFKAREAKGMTRTALADALGVSPASVIGWENNKWKPDAGKREKLAKALGVAPGELV
jgi:ribosome-binding protein aMBF1 (putative translation factor)